MNKLFESLKKGDTVILTNNVQRKLIIVRSVRSKTVVLENSRVFDLETGRAKDGSLNRISPYNNALLNNQKILRMTDWGKVPENAINKIINILQLCGMVQI